MATNPDLMVFQQILKVRKDLPDLEKDGKVAYGQTKYTYLSEEFVTRTINIITLRHDLTITAIDWEILPSNDPYTAWVKGTFEIKHAPGGDNVIGGGRHIIKSIGSGQDKGDKAIPKAMTMAWKYMLYHTFMIGKGNDPDCTSSEQMRDELKLKKEIDEEAKEKEQDKIQAELITKDQRDILSSKLAEHQVPQAAIKSKCATLGFKTSAEITQDKYNEIFDWIDTTYPINK